jgi:hypothetical protein
MIDFECLLKKTPFCHKLFSSDKFGRPIKTLWKYLLVLPLCISKEIPLRLRSVRNIGRDLTISKSAYKPQAVLGSLPTHPILSLITCYLSPQKGPFNTLSIYSILSAFWFRKGAKISKANIRFHTLWNHFWLKQYRAQMDRVQFERLLLKPSYSDWS